MKAIVQTLGILVAMFIGVQLMDVLLEATPESCLLPLTVGAVTLVGIMLFAMLKEKD